MQFIFRYIKPYAKLLIITLILAIINQVFSLMDPQIFRIIVDKYITNYQDYETQEFIY
ncbi:hypothetical protein GW750_01485 [bacterium]|nr:hypothetical protein [bacterium]